MKTEKEVKDELSEIAPGFPIKKAMDAPAGYFETLPDTVLNRWQKEKTHPMVKKLEWKRVVGIAAVLTGLCIGGMYLITTETEPQLAAITSAEAYQYIHENIDEFESLMYTEDIKIENHPMNVPQEDIDDYLIEELEKADVEELF